MLCIGYGRHPPQNMPETCVTITSMMTGATFYALFIAYSINVIQSMDSPGRSYREKVTSISTKILFLCNLVVVFVVASSELSNTRITAMNIIEIFLVDFSDSYTICAITIISIVI